MSTMKAVRLHSFGGPEVLVYEDAPLPAPGPGELLVQVHAAGVNPIDAKTRRGIGVARWYTGPFPHIIGWDISGVVAALGPGVTGFQAGDAVYGMLRFPDPAAAYAEYVTAPATQVARQPTALDHAHAAAVPLAALTAWQALFPAAGLAAGQKILIHAAAGGVGHLAVQLAKWQGAQVIGTASARNVELLRHLGADQVIDYNAVAFETAVHDVDVVLDAVAGDIQERSLTVLKPGGVLISILGLPAAAAAAAHGIRAAQVMVQPNAGQLAQIADLIDAGHLRPVVDTILPLRDARHAHELIENRHTRGKIVLQVRE